MLFSNDQKFFILCNIIHQALPFMAAAAAKSLQLGLTLCDAMDCSPPGSSVHGILQARTLEWVAMSSSRGSSQPKDRTNVSYFSCIGRQVLLRIRSNHNSPALLVEV